VTDLKATLERFGLKPPEFAEMIGRDARTVRRWCRNGAPIEVRALLEACDRLGWRGSAGAALKGVLAASGGDCGRDAAINGATPDA
jgi:hypothetical protein